MKIQNKLLALATMSFFGLSMLSAGAVNAAYGKTPPTGFFTSAYCDMTLPPEMGPPVVQAKDDDMPTFVLFYVDGKKIDVTYKPIQEIAGPKERLYQVSKTAWNLQSFGAGKHKLTAEILDADGNKALATSGCGTNYFGFTVAEAKDATPPVANWATFSHTVSGTQALSVKVSDDSKKIQKVEILVDDKLLGTATKTGSLSSTINYETYTYKWDTTKYTEGKHKVVAKAYDAAGNSSIAKSPFGNNYLEMTVKNKVDTSNSNVCEQKIESINKIISGIATRTDYRITVISDVLSKTTDYYLKTGKKVNNYDTLAIAADKAERVAEDELFNLQAKQSIDCSGDFKTQVKDFQTQLTKTRDAVSAYKKAVKDLLLAVKEAK